MVNKNIRTKYFIKANIHGSGAAYYSTGHTAQNADTISGYLEKGWLNLHEMGHGYEGSLAKQDLGLVEVMNNILAYYYQQTFLKENDYGWMGRKIDIEEDIESARQSATKFDDLSYKQKLYMFVNILDTMNPEQAMGYIHSKYREYLKQGTTYTASDMYSKSFTELENLNVLPYLNSFKINPSEYIKTEIYEKKLPMMYYLKKFVKTDERAEEIINDLGLDGKYALVKNSDLAKFNIKGSLAMNIFIDDYTQIIGKKLYLKNGENIVKEVTIESPSITISDIPIGIYQIVVPNPENAYSYDYQYIVIKEDTQAHKDIMYQKITIPTLASDTNIIFKGLGNAKFADVNMDLQNKKIYINSLNTQPHSYFSDQYANIKILDDNDEVLYEKSYIGNQTSPSNDTINIQEGYKIRVTHREAETRLIFQSQMLQEEEFKINRNEEVTFIITKYGLQREDTTEEAVYQNYKTKLDAYIDYLRDFIPQDDLKDENSYFIQRNKLFSNITNLNEEDKENYINNNKDLLGMEEEKPYEYEVGDINNDGVIDVTDVMKLKRYVITNLAQIVEDEDYIENISYYGDINQNETVDVTDILLLKRMIIEALVG